MGNIPKEIHFGRKAVKRAAKIKAEKEALDQELEAVSPWERKLREALYLERLSVEQTRVLLGGRARRKDVGKKGTGLKPSLDHVQASLILQGIRKGNFPEVAAQAQGVERYNWHTWMRIGEQWINDNPIAQVLDWRALIVLAVREAEAIHESRCVGTMDDAGKEDWKATESVLTKRHRERWGEKGTNIADLGIKRIVLEGADPSTVETEEQELARRAAKRQDS